LRSAPEQGPECRIFVGDVTNVSRLKSANQLEYAGGRGIAMKTRMVIVLLAACFAAGESFAADWPVTALPQPYRPGPLLPVEWTGLYFGVNAGYGWATGSSTTVFTGGPFLGGATTPFGVGATELGNAALVGSSSPRGGIAGGQIGFNWQAGMVVFGAEFDAQWSGQQSTAAVVCLPACTAAEAVKIRSLTTGRARIGLAFDWLMPYVTAGGALVNAEDNLTVTVGGVTGNFQSLSNTTLGWTAGAGVDIALSSNWSARFEYLHIRANDLNSSAPIPGILGAGAAAESAAFRDNIIRVALNYRFGPRGGPGVLESAPSPYAYALNYDFLPSAVVFADKAKPANHPPAAPAPVVAASSATAPTATAPAATAHIITAPVVTADAAPESSSITLPQRPAKSAFKNFDEIGALEDSETIGTQIELPKASSSKKRREKEEDESQRLKRIMSICAGC
jgi:outer membrane immunogenic protein